MLNWRVLSSQATTSGIRSDFWRGPELRHAYTTVSSYSCTLRTGIQGFPSLNVSLGNCRAASRRHALPIPIHIRLLGLSVALLHRTREAASRCGFNAADHCRVLTGKPRCMFELVLTHSDTTALLLENAVTPTPFSRMPSIARWPWGYQASARGKRWQHPGPYVGLKSRLTFTVEKRRALIQPPRRERELYRSRMNERVKH